MAENGKTEGGSRPPQEETWPQSRGFWRGRRVLVTGGAGFVGSHLVDRIELSQPAKIIVPRSSECDLRENGEVRGLLSRERPDVVIHLAAHVGGIGANRSKPGEFFYDNLLMGVHLLHESYQAGVEKFVAVGTICSYPKLTPVPFREEDFWNGYPEETNAPYGLAKKMLSVQADAYRSQYGFNSIVLLPVNIYGPRDHFDLETSHVIPALIRKFLSAKREKRERVSAWGTGSATREFLYVEDAAKAIALATERYAGAELVNIGSGQEISIRDLANRIARLTGFEGPIEWDASKPDGQPRRCLDTSRARKRFGFCAETGLEEGLRTTINWYLSHHQQAQRVSSR